MWNFRLNNMYVPTSCVCTFLFLSSFLGDIGMKLNNIRTICDIAFNSLNLIKLNFGYIRVEFCVVSVNVVCSRSIRMSTGIYCMLYYKWLCNTRQAQIVFWNDTKQAMATTTTTASKTVTVQQLRWTLFKFLQWLRITSTIYTIQRPSCRHHIHLQQQQQHPKPHIHRRKIS